MRSLSIAFYFATTFDWNGADLAAGLGGAETAVVSLAEEMARQGHRVTVFNATSRPGVHAGVVYLPAREQAFEAFDVLISVSRPPGSLCEKARVRVHLSMEDGESWVVSYRDYLPLLHAVFTISPYHTCLITERFDVPPEKIYTASLGVVSSDYLEPEPKDPHKLLYCSVPQAGLAGLESVYRLVKKEIPQVTLVVTGDATLWGHADPGLGFFRSLARMDGVKVLGKVPRQELVRHQKSSTLHVYPCGCNELFCLSSMECQAAGTPTVATASGALPDTIINGVTGLVVSYQPANGGREALGFAGEIISLLRNRSRLDRMALAARQRALSLFTYERIAPLWIAQFTRLLEGQPIDRSTGEWNPSCPNDIA